MGNCLSLAISFLVMIRASTIKRTPATKSEKEVLLVFYFIIIWVAIASQILIFLAPGLRRVPVWAYFRWKDSEALPFENLERHCLGQTFIVWASICEAQRLCVSKKRQKNLPRHGSDESQPEWPWEVVVLPVRHEVTVVPQSTKDDQSNGRKQTWRKSSDSDGASNFTQYLRKTIFCLFALVFFGLLIWPELPIRLRKWFLIKMW